MESEDRQRLETEIQGACRAGDLQRAASIALRGYGPEIFGFLVAVHRDEHDASEVFSRFAERLWRGLEGFAWQSSFRTWAYTIARNTSHRFRQEKRRREKIHVPLPESSELAALAQQVRSETLSYLRTERKQRIAQIRESLPADDQMLLVLRVDKQLAWNDLARIMHEDEGPLDEEALKREAARLRKRFQLVKEKLLAIGRREGLVRPRGPERE